MLLASSNFLVPNTTFIVELVAFLVVLGVLGKYILPYISKPMEERQAAIRQALNDAEEARRRAAEAEEEYKRAISEARVQARALVNEANRLAEQMRAEKRQQADEEYERIISRARTDIDAQVRQAAEALRQQVGELAIAVVEKVLGDGLDPQTHNSLIDRTIAEVEAQAGVAGVGSSLRQSIRGYTDAVIEQTADAGELSRTAAELAAFVNLLDGSQDLRRVLADPGVPVPSRRAVVTELLQDRFGSATLRLLTLAIEADRATEFRDDVAWLAARIEAAASDLRPAGDVVLGRRAAAERLDGYATGLLERLEDRGSLDNIEDELFRFMRTVSGSEELLAALTNRDVAASMRQSLVADLLRPQATPTTVSLAGYATQVGRPRDYLELLAHLVDRVATERHRRLAEVRVPVELDEDRRQHLADALSQVAGHAVEVRLTVDQSVLGGFVATMGDTVVDGSTRHRLDLLKERLTMPEAEITIGDPS